MEQSEPSAGACWQFGDYEVLEELGRGGMGAVYKAVQLSLDRPVALKMIHARYGRLQREMERFWREAKTAARVQHGNIVQIYEAGQLHGQSYFAMEYVEGHDMEEATADGPLSAEQAARYVVRVARAVHHLHTHGVLHRDLKPSNILIDNQDEPKVTDFGIARPLQDERTETTTGTVLGSPCYMAPEQATPEMGRVGPWTDVYGLGAVLYRLLTGRPPFDGRNVLDTMLQAVISTPPRPSTLNPRVPPMLEAICLKCLERSPDRRYGSAELLADDLERFLADEAVEAADLELATRLRRWLLRETHLVVHLLALSIVAMAKLALFLQPHAPRALLHVAGALSVWIVGCVILRLLQPLVRRPGAVGVAWAAMDITCLTATLLLATGIASPGVAAFGAIIVASALWVRVGPVAWATLLSLVALLLLMIDSLAWHPARQLTVDGYVIVAVTVCAVSLLVLRHVRRTRALSRLTGAA